MGADRTREIEARVNAATPGPWSADASYGISASEPVPDGFPSSVIVDAYLSDGNAAFIAHAREDVPWLLARVRELEATLARAAFVAEHLHQMIDRETWREHGAEWMGQYEGDHHAVRVQDEIKRWAALSGGSPANEDGDQ